MRRRSGLIITGVLLLAACGGGGSDDASGVAGTARTIDVTATEYAFSGDPGTIAAGDTIEFALTNAGELDHLLEVLSAEGSSLGRTERIGPGETTSVTVTFEEGGTYRLICDVDDHLSRGQSASITVASG